MDLDSQPTKHHFNLLKTVEGTGWILCSALNTMVRNNIEPTYDNGNPASMLANNMAEIFEVVSECEEPEVIEHIADKIVEYAGNDIQSYLSYMGKNMGDNPLYKRVYQIVNGS